LKQQLSEYGEALNGTRLHDRFLVYLTPQYTVFVSYDGLMVMANRPDMEGTGFDVFQYLKVE
jgi:hypothetical protein